MQIAHDAIKQHIQACSREYHRLLLEHYPELRGPRQYEAEPTSSPGATPQAPRT